MALADGHAHRRLWAIVVLAVIGCFVVTVALQTIDWAPAMKVE